MTRTLVVRLDNAGDVILSGPAVRAAAAHGDVVYLCGPAGEPAARLLPGVTEVLVWDAPWTGFDPPPVDPSSTAALVEALSGRDIQAAAILTSFHQSPLPMALLLRLAGIERIAAVSVDYPGSLLDHRLPYRDEVHEVEQALEVTTALGMDPPADDRLRLSFGRDHFEDLPDGYVVVHPSASVPARSIPVSLFRATVGALLARGTEVVVTGTSAEAGGDRFRGHPGLTDLRGATSFEELVSVVAGGEAVVAGNTGPAHIAAATGTPVVSVFAPVVPAHRWRPWRVPSVILGDQDISCAGCRSRRCPLPSQACVEGITAAEVLAAVDRLADTSTRRTA